MGKHVVVTQDSSANTAQTVTISALARQTGGSSKRYKIHSVTVTTKGADLAADIGILITTGYGFTWNAELRSGKVFGFDKIFGPFGLDCGPGATTVVVDAGGASVVTTCSVHYEVI